MTWCFNCFCEKTAPGPCPRCGYDPAFDEGKYPSALPHGSILAGQYVTGRVLGQGGFGVTYLAFDKTLAVKVAIKEYFPEAMAGRTAGSPQVTAFTGERGEQFRYGLERFLDEARTLAKFLGNPNIVGVRSYFEENGTAYFVMEYVEGVSLKAHLKNSGGKIPWQEAVRILLPVTSALQTVHSAGIIHRDIAPDNIYLTGSGQVKLLDFGAARYSLGDRSGSLDVILKHGYAPVEQYSRHGRQGPFTDVYALAATFYACVTGRVPPDAVDRLDGTPLPAPKELGAVLPPILELAVLDCLSVKAEERPQSVRTLELVMETCLKNPNPTPPQPKPKPPQPQPGGRTDRKAWANWSKKDRIVYLVGALILIPLLMAAGIFVSRAIRSEEKAESAAFSIDTGALGLSSVTFADPVFEACMREAFGREESLILNGDLERVVSFSADSATGAFSVGFEDGETYQGTLSGTMQSGEDLALLVHCESLSVHWQDFADLTPVSGLTELTELNLSFGEFSSLWPLEELTGLTRLDLSCNDVSDLRPLSGLTGLTELRLGSNAVSDLTPLSGLTGLTVLDINSNRITDLSPIAGLTGLTELNASLNEIPDLTPLAGMTQLVRLRLSFNSFSSLEPLRSMEKLELLDLGSTPVTELGPLAGLTSLTSLDLENCSVTDWSPVAHVEYVQGRPKEST